MFVCEDMHGYLHCCSMLTKVSPHALVTWHVVFVMKGHETRGGTTRVVQFDAIDHVPLYNLSRGVVLFAPLVSYLWHETAQD